MNKENCTKPVHIAEKDRDRLMMLASQWMEIACSPDVTEKKRLWKALHDLKGERPMILFETYFIANYIKDSDLICSDPLLRSTERHLLHHIKHYNEIKDDMVLDPYFRIGWETHAGSYGVDIVERHVEGSIAYKSNFPIQTPDDISKLKPREFSVDRESTMQVFNTLTDVFGNVLPVKLGNRDTISNERGYYAFNGLYSGFLTMDLFKLIGNDNLLYWTYDYPELLQEIMRYITDDRKQMLDWMLKEQLLIPNTDGQFSGPFSYGYVSDLPEPDNGKETVLSDCWIWSDSQETTMISPSMFDEFFLPYIAEISNLFGHTYYGCCERLDDRIEYILKKIHNVRIVSVSAWNKDYKKLADILGKNYVYCRKPNPSLLSGMNPNWEAARQDVAGTWEYTKSSNVEFIVRDLYDAGGDDKRGTDWVEMTSRILGL